MKHLGVVLKQLLIEQEMSQTALAEESDVPRNTLNRKLNVGGFTYDELTRIADARGMKLSTIIERTEALAARKEQDQ